MRGKSPTRQRYQDFNNPLDHVLAGVNRGFSPNAKHFGSLLIHVSRIHGVSTREGVMSAAGFPFTPEMERADVPGDDGVTR